MSDLRASMEEAGHGPQDVAELLDVPRRTVENWLSEGHASEIRPALLQLYRHMAGLERIPFRSSR